MKVGNLERQPVTCDHVRGERGRFPSCSESTAFASGLISEVQRITSVPSPPSFWPIDHSQIKRLPIHHLSLFSLHPLSLKRAPCRPSTHTRSLIPRLVSVSAPSNLLEVLSASQTFGLSPLLREWLHKPYTNPRHTRHPRHPTLFSLPLSSACSLA